MKNNQTTTPTCLKHIPQPSSCDIRFSRIQDQSVGDQRPQWQIRLKAQYASNTGYVYAETAIKTVTRDCKNISYRQLTAVDAKGTTAHFTGIHILGTHAVSQAADCVAVGNLLSSSGVANGISEGFLC